ncbi:nucleotide-binding universal stress UspA family protein [Georgenia soli]|uniref:Nucleotide-binding universal stress UspA family protein n=1 Tax=Georgenia soli TaxID=638953 RepID=A0A2A9EKZ9_9MICO|nr:universal stress protein [Georgenia soli]PFG38889.1 nucleotide-binding universal stress UspA family protein [Georgenia soli]
MSGQVFGRILVAVDDSPAALAAARLAVALAARTGGGVRFVHVGGNGEVTSALRAMGRDGALAARRSAAVDALLQHVAAQAEHEGITAETGSGSGQPAALVLAEARRWHADLVVLGRSDAGGPGRTHIGSVAREVLEFADVPVLVVPRP